MRKKVNNLLLLQLETALDGLFSAQCPEVFEGTGRSRHVFESFEAYGGKFHGVITKETEPFCGRYSVKNPHRIFAIGKDDVGVALSQFSKVCISILYIPLYSSRYHSCFFFQPKIIDIFLISAQKHMF